MNSYGKKIFKDTGKIRKYHIEEIANKYRSELHTKNLLTRFGKNRYTDF